MSETSTETRPPPILPRIEMEAMPAPRLETTEIALIPEEPTETSTLSLVLGGGGILALGLAALGTVNFVLEQFARSAGLGWLTLSVALAGFGLIGGGIWRELRGLFALRSVDRIRAELAAGDMAKAKPALRHWLSGLPDGEATIAALDAIDTPEAARALLRAGPIAAMRARADAMGRQAAVQMFAAAAAIPHPLFDGLLVAWRGTRLVRQIAELHGVRPGILGTWSLLRRTVLSAAGVVATDLAADALTRAVLSNPLLQHVAGDVAGAGVAARRMVVLARATAAACSPVPPNG